MKRKIVAIAPVNDLALNSDATRIISADADGKLRLWDAAPAAPPAAGAAATPDKPLLELAGHEKPVTAVATVFPDGTRVVSGSEDGSVRVWNLADGKQILSMAHGGPVTSVAVRPDGQAAASAGANNITRLWQLSDGKQLAEIKGSIPLRQGGHRYRRSNRREAKDHSGRRGHQHRRKPGEGSDRGCKESRRGKDGSRQSR